MNEKKSKRVRKAVGFHPTQPREYQPMAKNNKTVVSRGLRRAYQLAKRAVHQAGLA